MTKTREQILEKAASLSESSGLSPEHDDDFIADDAQEILLEIAGMDETSMLSESDTEDLLRSRDIYHFQSAAVRLVRKFLAE